MQAREERIFDWLEKSLKNVRTARRAKRLEGFAKRDLKWSRPKEKLKASEWDSSVRTRLSKIVNKKLDEIEAMNKQNIEPNFS